MPPGVYIRTKSVWNKGLPKELNPLYGRSRPDVSKRNILDNPTSKSEVREKISKSRKGQHNSPATEFKVKEDYTRRHRQWRQSVFEKDNHTCQKCGKTEFSKIEKVAHHIFPKELFPEKQFDPENGICLCSPYHMSFHDKYKNEPTLCMAQLEGWLERKYETRY